MPPPLLSFCIPTYNRIDLLLGCLEHLDAPGFLPFDFEAIVVDDASPHGQAEQARAFKPKHYRLEVVGLPRNLGLFPNIGGSLRRARGQFTVYLADDDRIIPDALAKTVEIAQAHPESVAVYSSWQPYDLVEQRALHPGYAFPEAGFDATSVHTLIDQLMALIFIPEIAVFRTAVLSQALFPAQIFFWTHLLMERLLRFGDVRTSGNVFYQSITRHIHDTAPRVTAAHGLRFNDWESVVRGYALLAMRYRDPAGAAPGPRDKIQEVGDRFHLQALLAAAENGRFLEAFEIGLMLTSTPGYKLPLREEVLASVLTGAAIEAVYRAVQGLPETAGLCLHGFDERLQQDIAGCMPELTVRQIGAVPRDELVNHAVLTRSEAYRRALIAQGCRPGFVFSMESLNQVFRF
jgi:glycosyltransferase involved in cell wall biosynthesis